jgi:hypothetical protein
MVVHLVPSVAGVLVWVAPADARGVEAHEAVHKVPLGDALTWPPKVDACHTVQAMAHPWHDTTTAVQNHHVVPAPIDPHKGRTPHKLVPTVKQLPGARYMTSYLGRWKPKVRQKDTYMLCI